MEVKVPRLESEEDSEDLENDSKCDSGGEYDSDPEEDADSEDATARRIFQRLPNEVLEEIFSHLLPFEMCQAALVCR